MKNLMQIEHYLYDRKIVVFKALFSIAIVFLVYSILFGITGKFRLTGRAGSTRRVSASAI